MSRSKSDRSNRTTKTQPEAGDACGPDEPSYVNVPGYSGPDRRKESRRVAVTDRRTTRRTIDKARAFLELEELADELADTPPTGGGTDEDWTGLERRRGPGRRRSDFMKAAEEGEMTREQFLFVMAIDAFKKANDVSYPTWTDVLEVLRLLGYRKTMKSELALRNAEDWTEPPDAPSNVHTGAGHLERERAARAEAERAASRNDDDDFDLEAA